MQTITLTNVLPHVFAARTDLKSEVWQQDVKFEKISFTWLRPCRAQVNLHSVATYWAIDMTIQAR